LRDYYIEPSQHGANSHLAIRETINPISGFDVIDSKAKLLWTRPAAVHSLIDMFIRDLESQYKVKVTFKDGSFVVEDKLYATSK
jgi:hypothetical protein